MTSIAWSVGPADPSADADVRISELDQPVRRRGHLQVASSGLAESPVADRLRQLVQFRHDPVALGRVRNPELNAAPDHLDAALGRHAGIAQDAPDVVAQLNGLGAEQILHIDFEQDVGPALKVEAEHDRIRRHDPVRQPARDCSLQRLRFSAPMRLGTARRRPIRITAKVATIFDFEKRSMVSSTFLLCPSDPVRP